MNASQNVGFSGPETHKNLISLFVIPAQSNWGQQKYIQARTKLQMNRIRTS